MVSRVPHLPVMGKNIEAGYTDVVRLEYPRFIAKVPPAANMTATLCLCLAEAAPSACAQLKEWGDLAYYSRTSRPWLLRLELFDSSG